MQILLEIPKNRYAFFKALVRMLSFPKIISVSEKAIQKETPLVSKEEFFAGLREAFEEVKQMEAGTLPQKSAREMLKEMERELANE